MEPTTSQPSRLDAVLAGEREKDQLRQGALVFATDPELRAFMRKALYSGSLASTLCSAESELVPLLRRNEHGVLVLGIDAPESIDCLSRLRQEFQGLPIVAVARVAGPELVRDVLCAGATDFLFGSFSTRKFITRLTAILEASRSAPPSAADAARPLREEARERPALPARPPEASAEADDIHIICRNQNMRRLLEIVDKIAPTESTVLIQGESGTGKELLAKRIHRHSPRSSGEFVEVNCGALPPNLLESQLFGHEKGSFTGAMHRQAGLFEIADKGTIFLDEVGEMSLDMQVKLLRVLQSRKFRRIGGSQIIKVDVRVIAASNKDLQAESEKGTFRSDLFYRLNVIRLEVPPLRDRLEEIPDLVELFCARISKERGLSRRTFAPETVERLQKYRWTGNVRELENVVERIILLSANDVIQPADLAEHLGESTEMTFPSVFAPTLTLDEVKRIHIANVLRENNGNKMRSARILKINVKTLYNLIKSLDIKV
jgi:DNA-binding NtrC family response regulator